MADDFPVVQPKEALAFFRNKGLTTGFAWQDVWQEEHARSFTVAKAMSRDLLEDIRGAVDEAMANGTTLADFQRGLKPLLERKGWWGRKEMRDPLTGEVKIVQLGSPRRLKTIFNINMRSAYAAGRWERSWRNRVGFPYLRYVHSHAVKEPRPEHLAWDGEIRRIDDPWWDTHYGPNGWGCQCTAQSVSEGMLKRKGWKVSDNPPTFPKVEYVNPRTGEVSKIERGIDPGFNFNIGRANLDSLVPRPGPGGEQEGNVAAALDGFLSAFEGSGEESKVIFDRGGWPLAIAGSWFRTAAGKLAAPGKLPLRADAAQRLGKRVGGVIVGPDEIRHAWVADAGGAQRLVRRYISGQGGETIGVEVGRTWRFVQGNAAHAWRDQGEAAWPSVSRPGRPAARTIDVLVDRALSEPDNRERINLGELGEAAPKEFRQLRRVLQADEFRHMIRRHGDPGKESALGQIAVTSADLKMIPQIVAAAGRPSVIRRKSGQHSLQWEAVIDGVQFIYAERIGVKHRRTIAKSLVKKPN